MKAAQIVRVLLETDAEDDLIDPDDLIPYPTSMWGEYLPDEGGWHPVSNWEEGEPGDYSTQFESDPVGNWKGHLTFYMDPEPDKKGVWALASAQYRSPKFSWNKDGWSGGSDLQWVSGSEIKQYWGRMLSMFKRVPNPWNSRTVPPMPGKGSWGY